MVFKPKTETEEVVEEVEEEVEGEEEVEAEVKKSVETNEQPKVENQEKANPSQLTIQEVVDMIDGHLTRSGQLLQLLK